MPESAAADPASRAAPPGAAGHLGIFPSQALRAALGAGEIAAEAPIGADQVQPASLDLRLGAVAYRVRASFLPGETATVEDKIRQFEMHQIDLSGGAVLERGCVYIVPLLERLALPDRVSGFANPKSSTGRLDVFTRVITDRGSRFDWIARGYRGPLYAEVSPRTFSILVRAGSRLTQLRLRRGTAVVPPEALLRLHAETPLVDAPLDAQELREHGGIPLRLDLAGDARTGLAGWRARKHAGVIDIDRIGGYPADAFWEPVRPAPEGVILDPDAFHIFATAEAIAVPPGHAAEMVPYDTLVGEFRVHYAGFFDPGFGYDPGGGAASRAVLEVRSHDVPFLMEHGQRVGRLRYERLAAVPDRLYGRAIGSSYQGQGLALARQFRA